MQAIASLTPNLLGYIRAVRQMSGTWHLMELVQIGVRKLRFTPELSLSCLLRLSVSLVEFECSKAL